MKNRTDTTKNRKMRFEENDYKKLYPIGSRPRLFYGTPKVRKLEKQ